MNSRKGNLYLKEYIWQIKNLVDPLKSAGHMITVDDHILHILAGFGSEYESMISVITTKSGITMQEVISLLLSHKSRLIRETSLQPSEDPTLHYSKQILFNNKTII